MNTRRLSGSLAAIAALLLLAVGLVLSQPAAAQGDDPIPTPFYEEADDPELVAAMDRMEEAASILRALEPSQAITRAFITRADLLDYLLVTVDRDYPPEAARDDAIFYSAFGFMPLDTDLRQLQIDVLEEQVAGFYDTDLEAMFVVNDGSLSAMDQVIYVHEFTHVLQDQNYDLDTLLAERMDALEPDQLLALLGLVEGDAMIMTEGYQQYLLRNNPTASFGMLSEALFVGTEQLGAAPAIIQRELLFPYTQGRDFVYALFVEGDGWPLVNAAYENLPVSTEQILHPEAYLAGELPLEVQAVPVDDLLGDGWRLVWDRALGEFYLGEHLATQINRRGALAAAAGWGGDDYLLYFNEDSEAIALVLRILWDTPADGAEFDLAYREYAASRFAQDTPAAGDSGESCWTGETDALCLLSGDSESLVVAAPDADLASELLVAQ